MVVDAKVPLEAFLDAHETSDEQERTARLQLHARQVRDHMDKLGGKGYWEQLGSSPEMVVMFLPGETLFSAALQHDLSLIEHGLQRRVLLASPITLIALLTTVAHTWRQEALADNYREVARAGARVLRPRGQVHRLLRRPAPQARRRRAGLQPGGRLVREPRARQRPAAARAGRDHEPRDPRRRADRHGAARADARWA